MGDGVQENNHHIEVKQVLEQTDRGLRNVLLGAATYKKYPATVQVSEGFSVHV
jgi:formyltetrahydrofolate synthetase